MYDMLWNDLYRDLSEIAKSSSENKKPIRSQESILEEILNLNRNIYSEITDSQILIVEMLKINNFALGRMGIPIPTVTGLGSRSLNIPGSGTAGTSGISVSPDTDVTSAPGPLSMSLREAARIRALNKMKDENKQE